MPYRVIVIDDDIDVIDAFSEYLKIKDIDVLGVGDNGKVALDLYKQFRPDVVFLDAKMPRYDGFYGLQKILDYDPEAKIIVATASISQNTAQRIMNMKAKAIIYKPCDIDFVIDTIKRVCNGESLPIPNSNRF